MTYRDGLLHKFTLPIDCVVLQGRVTNKNHYIHYQSLYDHQTWQDYNLLWWAPIDILNWPFNHVVLPDHVTN